MGACFTRLEETVLNQFVAYVRELLCIVQSHRISYDPYE